MGNLFRKEAVDNYTDNFSSDRQITRLSVSIMVLAPIFIVGLLLAGIWFVFGNIVDAVDVVGIVYPAAGIDEITAPNEGVISDMSVSVGERIGEGYIVAVIPNEEILNDISQAEENDRLAEKLRREYHSSSVVRAKRGGTVLSVANEGSYAKKGDVIATVAAEREDNDQRQILALLPTSKKNNIEKGCAVQVSPDYAPRESFGYINGYVAAIENNVITKSDAERDFNIYNIPQLLDENETYIAVYINLLSDSETASGLDWSEKNSGDIDIGSGTVCGCSIVVSSMSPCEWLLGGGGR